MLHTVLKQNWAKGWRFYKEHLTKVTVTTTTTVTITMTSMTSTWFFGVSILPDTSWSPHSFVPQSNMFIYSHNKQHSNISSYSLMLTNTPYLCTTVLRRSVTKPPHTFRYLHKPNFTLYILLHYLRKVTSLINLLKPSGFFTYYQV